MLAVSFSSARCLAQDPFLEIQDLYESTRIPNIVVATDGSVLAFAKSGRLLRRSADGGKTWSAAREVGHDAGGSAIVDTTSGDVLVVRAANAHLWRSSDHGETWQREKTVVKPNPLGQGSPDTIRVQTSCSESGITLQHGKHKGRLLMPARIQPPKGDNAQEWWPYNYNTAIFSDDGGKTWQTSAPVQSGTGEGTLAELSTGAIYYNSRSHMSVDHRRRISWSHDGGAMFVDWSVSKHLYEVGQPFYFKYGTKPSYGCNAGLVRLPPECTDGHDVLLFSTPDDPGGTRVRMTVWASFDGAKTWPVKRTVYDSHSAYSSLAAAKDGSIYLLFERGRKKLYESIAVARFNLAWLTNGKDWRTYLPSREPPVAMTGPAVTPLPRVVDWWFARHAEKIGLMSKGDIDLLMVGDSITHNFESVGAPSWKKVFEPLKAINLGFGGDRTNHVLWRLDHLPKLKVPPKGAVVLIGTNNICWGSDKPEEAALGVRAVAVKLGEFYPEMEILVLGVFPRRRHLDHPHRKEIIELNSCLPDLLASLKNVKFVDIGEKFLDEKGFLSEEMMPDTTHPSEKGHEIWAQAIEAELKRMLAP